MSYIDDSKSCLLAHSYCECEHYYAPEWLQMIEKDRELVTEHGGK